MGYKIGEYIENKIVKGFEKLTRKKKIEIVIGGLCLLGILAFNLGCDFGGFVYCITH